MTKFGWTIQQIAYAKQRHNRQEGVDLPADNGGLITLRDWWVGNMWPDPLSVCFEGVDLESDIGWASKVMGE